MEKFATIPLGFDATGIGADIIAMVGGAYD
jgi:hypothetical protein